MKIAVLISGRGSNLQALIEATRERDYPAEICTVISNVPGVAGLARAEEAGLATQTIDHRLFEGRAPFEDAVHDALIAAGAELVCLAGFMRLLTENFLKRWTDRVINIHPSLLPAFRGLHVHERVIAYGARFSGCTVHFVRPAMDDGPIIVQAAIPVHRDDEPDRLATRVLAEEHRILPLAVRWIAERRVRIVGDRVEIDNAPPPEGALINPLYR